MTAVLDFCENYDLISHKLKIEKEGFEFTHMKRKEKRIFELRDIVFSANFSVLVVI